MEIPAEWIERDRLEAQRKAGERASLERRAQLELSERAQNVWCAPADVVNAVILDRPLVETKVRAAARKFVLMAEAQWRVLLMGGSNGTGKTTAAVELMLRDPTWKGAPPIGPRFISSTALAALQRAGFSGEEKRYDLTHSRLVVIDDVGMGPPDEAFSAIFETLLVERYDAGLLTVLTANMGWIDFKHRFSSPRILSRIEAHGLIAENRERDFRGEVAAKRRR